MRRNITELIQVLRSYLRYVKIYQMTVVCINLIELVFGKILNIEKSLNMHILMRENH